MTRIWELKAALAAGLAHPGAVNVVRELCAIYESELARKDAALRAAEAITDWGRVGITQMAMFQAACDRVHADIRSALTPATETGETK